MDPTPEEAAEGSILVKVLAVVLERLVNSNTATARTDPGQVTKFHALKAPGIGVEAYLDRIHKYASCSNECFILALIYIDRLIERNNFLLTELNVHRVVITAILLAAKFFDDAYYNNAYYAKVGGVLVSELNGLEVDFLFRINFSLHVQPNLFEKYKAELVAHSINSGFIPPRHLATPVAMSNPLTKIPETESGSSSRVEIDFTTTHTPNLNQHEHEYEQLTTTRGGTTAASANYDVMRDVRSKVTPSPPPQSDVKVEGWTMGEEMFRQMHQIGSSPLTKRQQKRLASLHETRQLMQQYGQIHNQMQQVLNGCPVPGIQHQHQMEPEIKQIQHQQQNQQRPLGLRRANSLCQVPLRFTTKVPYSVPPLATAYPLEAEPIYEMNYSQMMTDELYPIETTLVHINHQGEDANMAASSTIPSYQAHPTGGLVSHHAGGGLAHMAYELASSV